MASRGTLTVATTATTAQGIVDTLLDELKLAILERLTPEELDAFVAGKLAVMATIRMRAAGRVPEADSAVYTTERLGPG